MRWLMQKKNSSGDAKTTDAQSGHERTSGLSIRRPPAKGCSPNGNRLPEPTP